MSTPLIKRRTAILTASAIAITAVGAYTGAQLKTDVETRAEVAKVRAVGIDVKIQRFGTPFLLSGPTTFHAGSEGIAY